MDLILFFFQVTVLCQQHILKSASLPLRHHFYNIQIYLDLARNFLFYTAGLYVYSCGTVAPVLIMETYSMV